MSRPEPYDGEVFIVRGECDKCKIPVEWCGRLTPFTPAAKCAGCGSIIAWLCEEDDD